MGERFFVASCVFTEGEPELSRKVQTYVKDRFSLPIIRCCVAKYKVQEFEERMACEYCHGKGNGQCVQKDDMQKIYVKLHEANMLVLAAPIYYHGISGQLKCVIDRFYAMLYPVAPPALRKVSMFLSSGDDNMYDGAKFSYEGDFLGYLGLEDMGIFTNHDRNVLPAIRKMAMSL